MSKLFIFRQRMPHPLSEQSYLCVIFNVAADPRFGHSQQSSTEPAGRKQSGAVSPQQTIHNSWPGPSNGNTLQTSSWNGPSTGWQHQNQQHGGSSSSPSSQPYPGYSQSYAGYSQPQHTLSYPQQQAGLPPQNPGYSPQQQHQPPQWQGFVNQSSHQTLPQRNHAQQSSAFQPWRQGQEQAQSMPHNASQAQPSTASHSAGKY